MKLQINGSAEFATLLQALANELVDAQIHFKLFEDLLEAYRRYATEFSQSNTFWSLTLDAHLDATIVRLCKAYDQDKTSLNLRNFLDTVLENLYLFDESSFRERMSENSFVESLAANRHTPDVMQIQWDIDSVTPSEPIVKKLTIWRNNYYSHRNATHVLDPDALLADHPFMFSDVKSLLTNGVAIVNRYSYQFNATYFSTQVVGCDDYRSLLEAVRKSVERYKAAVEADFLRLDSKS